MKITKMWQVLQKAKWFLAKDSNEATRNAKELMICFCISFVNCNDEIKQCTKSYIHKLLGSSYGLGGWISKNYPELAQETLKDCMQNHSRKLQETRLAWINWMISDLKSKNL